MLIMIVIVMMIMIIRQQAQSKQDGDKRFRMKISSTWHYTWTNIGTICINTVLI
jgi:hypothetical protein